MEPSTSHRLSFEFPAPKEMSDIRLLEVLETERVTLRDWLHETYSDNDKRRYFSKVDIDALGALLNSVMQYRPSDRPRAPDLLNHTWFQRNPFAT